MARGRDLYVMLDVFSRYVVGWVVAHQMVFDVLALLVVVDTTPIMFTLFMFIGQPLFAGPFFCSLRRKLIAIDGVEPRLASVRQTYYCPWHAQPIESGALS